uniref:Acyltransferase n=1 Tax=Moschus moschiferus TaxID=68415 RepID=A0A8C6FK33_MOSMO
ANSFFFLIFPPGPFLSLLAFYLLFTSLRSFSVLHFIRLSPGILPPISAQRGRRSQWMRNWSVWKHLRDYFPTKPVKTAELAPDGNYLLVAHPHETTSIRTFCNFCTESTGFSHLTPGLQPWLGTMNGIFYIPVYRNYVMGCGLCSASHQRLDFILSQPQLGQAVVILFGGELKALYAILGEHCLTLWNRKGFLHLALRHGVPLVPVYSFGEKEAFTVKPPAPDSWQHLFQTTFKKLMYFSPCILWGRGLFSNPPLTCVPCPCSGHPIPVPQCPQPTGQQVDHSLLLFVKALEQPFKEHKERCGLPASTHLTFI